MPSIHSIGVGERGTASRAPGCCRSGRGGTARARCRGRGTAAPSGRSPRSARCARSPAGEHSGEPQPAVAGEALLRREVVDVELASGRRAAPPAPEVASTRTSRRRPSAVGAADRRPSRRSTSRCAGSAYASTSGSACGVGMRAGAATRSPRGRRGAARPRRPPRTSTRTRRTTRCWLRRSIEAERGGVPERRSCRRCRAAPRSRRGARRAREAVADAAHHGPHAVAAVARAEVAAAPRRRARRRPRGAPSTARSRSGRRTGRSSAGRTMPASGGRASPGRAYGAVVAAAGSVRGAGRTLGGVAGLLLVPARAGSGGPSVPVTVAAQHRAERDRVARTRTRCDRRPRSRCRTRTSRARTSRRCGSRSGKRSNHFMIDPVAEHHDAAPRRGTSR